MLHKNDSMIAADFILRMLRSDHRLQYINGFISPFVNNQEYGYTIDFIKTNSQYSISFALNKEGRIVVYRSSYPFIPSNIEKFDSDQFNAAKEYIISSAVLMLKSYNLNSIPLKFDSL
jgi:hypothetical protein